MGHQAPPFFYTLGDASLLSRPGVALLGDMNISSRGETNAFMAARELTRHDITVLGGMSRGAGVAAHRGALESRGTTVAVLPMGILNLNIPPVLQEVYDPEHFCIASPFYPRLEADKYRAYNRNRLICALSRAVYIIEAPEEGGIFEAAKSARDLKVPLYTTEYSRYPESASGNRRIMEEMDAKPVRGRMVNDMLSPNLDSLIADVKFGH
jgi:DNA processing protein